jgi:hypothetical protein
VKNDVVVAQAKRKQAAVGRRSSKITTAFGSFGTKTDPFEVLHTGKKSSLDLVKFLLDLQVGFPLFFEESNLNSSLESFEDFQNYLALARRDNANNGRYSKKMEDEKDANENDDDHQQLFLSTEPLFPLSIFYKTKKSRRNKMAPTEDKILLLEKFPMAIPYFNHWWILLGEDEECFVYVVRWIAKIATSPGDMSNICGLVFYSKLQGIGKSLAIKMTMSLFAPFVQETQSVEQIFTRFSDLMEFALLLHIEDAPRHHLHKHHDQLKGRMTADKLFVERKNQPIYNVTNFCRIMLSTNEDLALKLTPDDRRWAAFECSPVLHQKRGYFDDLARYWKLHQSKCQVMRVLQRFDVTKFDAEKQRPLTPYLISLMHHGSNTISNTNLLASGLDEVLVYSFVEGLKGDLQRINPSKRLRKFSQILSVDIFHHDDIKDKVNSKKKTNKNNEESRSCYYIRFSILADLFFIWAYGSPKLHCGASHMIWKLLERGDRRYQPVHREFKRVLSIVAPELKSLSFAEKHNYSYYIIDPNQKKNPYNPTQFAKVEEQHPVDLFALYRERTMHWKDLKENLPMGNLPLTETQIRKKEEEKQLVELRKDEGDSFPLLQEGEKGGEGNVQENNTSNPVAMNYDVFLRNSYDFEFSLGSLSLDSLSKFFQQ